MSHNDFDHRHYVIISSLEIDEIVFDQVLENSVETLRTSVDGTQTFIKYSGDEPSFLSNCTTKSEAYSHDDFLEIVSTATWSKGLHDVDTL